MAGPVEMPHGPWPAAPTVPPVRAARPRAAARRATAGARSRAPTSARRSPGTKRWPRDWSRASTRRARPGSVRNVDPSETCRPARTRLKMAPAAASPPVARSSTPTSSSTCVRRIVHLDVGHDAPDRHDRLPGASGVDQLGRPGPRRHEHRAGRAAHPGGEHAARAARDHPGPRRLALVEAGAGGVGPTSERARGGHRLDGVAGLEPARPEPAGHAGLEGAHGIRVEQRRFELGAVAGELAHRRLERRPLRRQHEHAGRASPEARSRRARGSARASRRAAPS